MVCVYMFCCLLVARDTWTLVMKYLGLSVLVRECYCWWMLNR